MTGAGGRTRQGVAAGPAADQACGGGETLSTFDERFGFFVHLKEGALHGVYFPFFKYRLATLCADPGRDCIPVNLIAFPIHAERRRVSFHCSFAIRAFHHVLLRLKSSDH